MRTRLVGLLWLVATPLAAQAPLPVVPDLDLARYAGVWYEIARLPNRFQRHCAGEVTATYALRADGDIDVLNACRRADDSVDRAQGVARRADPAGPATRLEVRFAPAWLGWLPLVWGDYWVIELAPDYRYSVVGTPDRKYLWVLAREPSLDEATYQGILERAAAQGFATTQVIRTRQRF